ncbi:MAG: B12-binding domain-containing radical SAM protein [Omnitrophica WOR_2 bacterium]
MNQSSHAVSDRAKRHRHSNKTGPADGPVLYVHPAKQGTDLRPDPKLGRPYALFPLGLPALINTLRENGVRVKGINHALEVQVNPNFNLTNWLKAQHGARIVLIDLHWYEHCYGAIRTAQACKEALPGVWTVLGGLSASGFAREILENFSEVDFIVRGDAEKPLLDLVQLLRQNPDPAELHRRLAEIPNLSYRDANGIVENPLGYCATTADLDALNFVDIDFLEHYREYSVHEYIVTDLSAARRALQSNPLRGRWLCTARGCKYECSYCGGCRTAHQELAGRNGLVIRSPEKVVQDLLRLKKYGVNQASLSYDIAELGEEYWKAFFKEIEKNRVRIGLYNEFFQSPVPEFIEWFARNSDPAQSCVALSPLSGSERVRRLNGKIYTNEQIFDTLNLLSQNKLYLIVYFSINLPGEDNQAFQETLDLAREIYEFYPHSLLKILNTAHTIDPLSPMNTHAGKFNIETSMSTFMDYYNYCRNTRFASPEARTEKQRGFHMSDAQARSVEDMANRWDRARSGKEDCWWPVPPSW